MRNLSVKNTSPDLTSLLIQGGKPGRAGSLESSNLSLEQLLGELAEQEGAEGDAFENVLSMLTMGQGESPEKKEGDVTNLLNMLEGKTKPSLSSFGMDQAALGNTEGKIGLEGFIPVQKTEVLDGDLGKILNSKFDQLIRQDGKTSGEISGQKNSSISSALKDLINKSSLENPENVLTAEGGGEEAELSFLNSFKQGPAQSKSSTAQNQKMKGELSSSDFVGLKEGLAQNKMDTSMQGNRKAIPMSYMGEQNKMLASNIVKKNEAVNPDGMLMKNGNELNATMNPGMAVQGNQQNKDARFDSMVKNVAAKNQLESKSNNLNDAKSNEVIGKINDYIVKSQFEKNNTLDVTFKHNDLGNFQVKVSKEAHGQGVDIVIRPQTAEAQKFFSEHESALLKGLGESGLKVLDFKVSSSGNAGQSLFSENKNDSSTFNQQFKNEGKFGQSQQQGQNREDSDSQRRNRLWEEARERLETQYA